MAAPTRGQTIPGGIGTQAPPAPTWSNREEAADPCPCLVDPQYQQALERFYRSHQPAELDCAELLLSECLQSCKMAQGERRQLALHSWRLEGKLDSLGQECLGWRAPGSRALGERGHGGAAWMQWELHQRFRKLALLQASRKQGWRPDLWPNYYRRINTLGWVLSNQLDPRVEDSLALLDFSTGYLYGGYRTGTTMPELHEALKNLPNAEQALRRQAAAQVSSQVLLGAANLTANIMEHKSDQEDEKGAKRAAVATGVLAVVGLVALIASASGPNAAMPRPGDRYQGETQGGFYHGYGMLQRNKHTYLGAFSYGRYAGWGVLQYPNGSLYEGGFERGVYTGYGEYYAPGDNLYMGVFDNGQLKSNGKAVFAHGGEYTGQFHNNRPAGRGDFQFPHGPLLSSEWKNGRPHGQGEFRLGPVRLESRFRNAMLHGRRGRLIFADGVVLEAGKKWKRNEARRGYVLRYPHGEVLTAEAPEVLAQQQAPQPGDRQPAYYLAWMALTLAHLESIYHNAYVKQYLHQAERWNPGNAELVHLAEAFKFWYRAVPGNH